MKYITNQRNWSFLIINFQKNTIDKLNGGLAIVHKMIDEGLK
jgi:hypothetical protein